MVALPPPTPKPLEASTQTGPPSSCEMKDIYTQTDETANTVSTEGPIHKYEEELVVQMVTVDKAKERYEKAKAKVDWIKEQVAKSDVELQQLLHNRTA